MTEEIYPNMYGQARIQYILEIIDIELIKNFRYNQCIIKTKGSE